MSKNISIPSGITVIGNSQDSDLSLATLGNNDINSYKTLINGVWKSWSLGTPEAFQGFASLDKGMGYVVNATADTDITFAGAPLDVNTLTINPGLNILALPYPDKKISNGYLPRLKISTLKTIDGSWKSWSAGTPDAFQGFTALDDSKGYVCNVEAIYDSFLNDAGSRDVNDGVQLGKVVSVTNAINAPIDVVDGFDHWFEVKTIDSPTPITINPALPKKTMHVNIDGKVRKLEFPQEYLGSRFVVRKLGYTVIDYGKINEPAAGPTTDYGLITDPETASIVYDRMDTIQVLAGAEYEFTFVENIDANGATVVETFIVDDVLEIMYDRTAFNASNDLRLMNINLAGIKTRLSFAVEYAGQPFVIIKDNENYPGTFTESDAYIVL